MKRSPSESGFAGKAARRWRNSLGYRGNRRHGCAGTKTLPSANCRYRTRSSMMSLHPRQSELELVSGTTSEDLRHDHHSQQHSDAAFPYVLVVSLGLTIASPACGSLPCRSPSATTLLAEQLRTHLAFVPNRPGLGGKKHPRSYAGASWEEDWHPVTLARRSITGLQRPTTTIKLVRARTARRRK